MAPPLAIGHNHAMDLETLAGALSDAEPGDARAVLRLVVDRALGWARTRAPVDRGSACPNCGGPASSTRSPYCCDFCREEAAFVRQFRTSRAQGTLAETEKQERLGQALWHLLGGGYPHRLPLIPPSARKQALKRTGGRCEGCGAAATTFDHVGSG